MMKYIVSVSGGKDSTACLLYMLERVSKEDIVAVFCDTGWENEITYKYLDYLEKKLDIEIVRIKSEGMEALCDRKNFVINRTMRSCTIELKIKPFEKWLKENFVNKNIEFIVVEGIRRDESESRSNTETFEIKKSILKGEKFMKPTLYPLAYWNTDKVFKYIESKKVKINPLYQMGRKRVGCEPCIFASKWELLYLPKKYKDRLNTLENTIGNKIGKEAFMFNKGKQKHLKAQKLFDTEELFKTEEELLAELEKDLKKWK